MGFIKKSINKGYNILGTINTIDRIASGQGISHEIRKSVRKHVSPEHLIGSFGIGSLFGGGSKRGGRRRKDGWF